MSVGKSSRFNMKFLVVCIVVLGACAVLVTVIAFQSHLNFKFTPKRMFLAASRGMNNKCKPLKLVENINWSYLYYYENPTTRKSVIWCKVPKAGSTSLTKLFLRVAGAKNIQNNTRIHKMLRDFFPRLPPANMKQKLKFSKSFMIIRDPFERILSAYRDKLEDYQRDLKFRDGYYYEHFGRFMVKQDDAKSNNSDFNSTGNVTSRREPTWKEFVQYLLHTSVARYDEHWMPITRLCSPCNINYDAVIKMENLQNEIQTVLKHAGIHSTNVGWAHRTGTANKKIIANYFKNLTLNEVKKLYAKYKRDFQIFGYTPFKYYHMAVKNI